MTNADSCIGRNGFEGFAVSITYSKLLNLEGRQLGNIATANIFGSGNSLQVVRVNASWISALMVNFQTTRDRSFTQFIHHTMSANLTTIMANKPVSCVKRLIPFPASGVIIDCEL